MRSSFGDGERFGGPPMSAIRGLPERPGAARLKGDWRRSGQETIETETCSKLDERVEMRGSANSSSRGGESGTFCTDQGAMATLL